LKTKRKQKREIKKGEGLVLERRQNRKQKGGSGNINNIKSRVFGADLPKEDVIVSKKKKEKGRGKRGKRKEERPQKNTHKKRGRGHRTKKIQVSKRQFLRHYSRKKCQLLEETGTRRHEGDRETEKKLHDLL